MTAPNAIAGASPDISGATSLDAAIDTIGESIDTSETPPEVGEPGAAEPEPEVTPEPEPEVPVEPEPAAVEPEPDELADDEIAPDKVSDNGKLLQFNKNKAGRLMAALDFQRQVQEIVPNATVQDLKANYERAVVASEMVQDFDSGDPARVEKWANFWVNENSNPQSVATLADAMITRLPHTHPQVFQRMEKTMTGRIVQTMYEDAVKRGDDGLFKLAQNLDYRNNGKFLTAQDFQNRDPFQEKNSRLEEQLRALQEERQQFARQKAQDWDADTDRAIDTSTTEEIEKAIPQAIKDAFKDKPQWKHMVRDLREFVDDAKKANPTFMRAFQNEKQKARTRPSDESRQALVAMMRQFAAPVIARHRKGVIETATGTVMGASKAMHQKLSTAATKTEPAGGGSPSPRVTKLQKLEAHRAKGGGWDDAWAIATEGM